MEISLKQSHNFQYYDEGTGPTILILHGLFGSLSNFEELIKLARGRFRFVMPVLPIYTCDISKANVTGMLDYLMDFIESFHLRNYTLLGNSLGGHIALVHELKYPDKSKALILTGSSGLFENTLGNDYPKRDRDAIREKILDIFGNKNVVTDLIIDEAFEIITNYTKVLRVLKMAKSAVRQNLANEIDKIKKTALLIWGTDDVITPPFVAEQFHEKLSNSELAFIAKCGHAPMMEYPKEFSEILFPFLDQIYSQDERLS